jgi:hypothetical protein
LSLCDSSAYISTEKQIKINIHKRNNTKNNVQTIQNTVNTITPTRYKTHKNTHPYITQEVKTTTVQDTQ